MPVASVARTAWRSARHRSGRIAATVAAVTLAATMSVGAFGVAAQFERTFGVAAPGTEVLRAVPEGSVVVTAAGTDATEPTALSEALVERARSVEGVLAASGTYEQPIAARIERGSQDDRPPMFRGLVFTSEWDPTTWRVLAGTPPSDDRSDVVPVGLDRAGLVAAGASLGDPLRLQTPIGGVDAMVVAVVEPVGAVQTDVSTDEGASTAGVASAHIVIDRGRLPALLGAVGRVDRITVTPQPGTSVDLLVDRLDDALPDGVRLGVATDAEVVQARAVSAVSGGVVAATWAFAAVSALVAALLVSNTFSIVVAQRREELALARCLGATRGQTTAVVVAEAGLVGTLAAAVGVVLGVPLSMLGATVLQPGARIEAVLTTEMVAAAVVVGLVVTLVASVVPALRAARIAPVEAMRAAGARRRRRGPLLALLGPVLAAAGWAARKDRVASMATAAARTDPRRAAATVSTLMVGIGSIAMVLTVSVSIREAISNQFVASSEAELLIRRRGVVRVDAASLERRLEVPPGTPGFVALASVEGTLIGPEGSEPVVHSTATELIGSVVDLGVVDALERQEVGQNPADGAPSRGTGARVDAGRGVRLATVAAQRMGVTLGDAVTLRSVSGEEVRLTVDALYDNVALAGPAVVDRAAAVVVDAEGSFEIAAIDLPADAPVDRIRRGVDRRLAGFNRLTVDTPDGLLSTDTDIADTATRLVLVLLSGSLLLGGLGAANNVSLSVLERRRELALLRTVGATRRQVRRLVSLESVLLCGTAGVFGAAIGTCVAVVAVHLAPASFGAQPIVPWVPLTTLVVGAVAIGAVAAAVPALAAARRRPIDDLYSP